jgi:hypothetical protein
VNRKSRAPAEIVVPISVFCVLRRELEKEVGMLPAVQALHHAGFAAGQEALDGLTDAAGDGLADLSASTFWARLAAYFQKRGWGTAAHESPHPGVGLLAAEDWAEAVTDTVDPEASCSFSTGFLSGLLSGVAGEPVAVLEVACRSRGDDACRFAFGSADVVQDLYGHLLEGAELPRALAEL